MKFTIYQDDNEIVFRLLSIKSHVSMLLLSLVRMPFDFTNASFCLFSFLDSANILTRVILDVQIMLLSSPDFVLNSISARLKFKNSSKSSFVCFNLDHFAKSAASD